MNNLEKKEFMKKMVAPFDYAAIGVHLNSGKLVESASDLATLWDETHDEDANVFDTERIDKVNSHLKTIFGDNAYWCYEEEVDNNDFMLLYGAVRVDGEIVGFTEYSHKPCYFDSSDNLFKTVDTDEVVIYEEIPYTYDAVYAHLGLPCVEVPFTFNWSKEPDENPDSLDLIKQINKALSLFDDIDNLVFEEDSYRVAFFEEDGTEMHWWTLMHNTFADCTSLGKLLDRLESFVNNPDSFINTQIDRDNAARVHHFEVQLDVTTELRFTKFRSTQYVAIAYGDRHKAGWHAVEPKVSSYLIKRMHELQNTEMTFMIYDCNKDAYKIDFNEYAESYNFTSKLVDKEYVRDEIYDCGDGSIERLKSTWEVKGKYCDIMSFVTDYNFDECIEKVNYVDPRFKITETWRS